LVQALESHTFEPVKLVQWRNTDLDFSSIGALQATLAMAPTEAALARAPTAEDILVLDHASREDDVRAWTTKPADVERLWEVCQVPDYRKIAPANHAELVVTLYGYLQRDGKVATDWFARQIAENDRTDGDIDTLSTRIAHIRTWTFVANRPDWLADPEHWQGVTRGVEDKLSDALHERLTERFVDRRTSVLMRRLRENATLEPEINKTGDVVVEGHVIGRLDGFMFVADASSGGSEAKALQNAAQKALAGEIGARATRLAEARDEQFALASDGAIRWTGAAVGKLIAGEQVLRPRVRIVADEHLTGAPRDAVEARLDAFVKSHLEKLLGPLFVLSAAEDVTGIARGVAFQLVEALGVLERQKVAEDVKGLEQPSRATLRKYGVRFGAYHIYVPALLKPGPRALAAQLWALAHDGPQTKGLDDLLHLAGSGRTSIPVNREIDAALYGTAGYRVSGERAVRVDILERLADLIRPALSWREGAPGMKPPGAIAGGGFTVVNGMTSLTGASGEDFASILRSLGYRMERRPKPAEPAQAAAPVEHVAAPVETASPAESDPEAQTPPVEGEAAARESAPEVSHAAVQEPLEAALQPAADLVTASPTAEIEETETAAAPSSADAEVSADVAPEKPAEEPVMIEVWRPGWAGRPEGPRRPRFKRREMGRHKPAELGAPRQPDEAVPAVAAAPTEASPPSAASGATEEPHAKREHRHHRRPKPEQRFDRPPRQQDRDRERPPRPQRFDRREREKAPDPNSPFAKLAALKAQLEADAKERR
jgi:ATP-dependent RNA helicase SUPV3L1/SUV3